MIRDVDQRGAFSNLSLSNGLRGLDERDRALATELTYGTLRCTGQLDHVLQLGSDRPVADIDAHLRDVLRIGVYQLLHTRVPSHAAVTTTVDLAHEVAGPAASRFTNAVMRRVSEHIEATDDPAARVLAPPRSRDPIGWLGLVHAHPNWVVEAFARALGNDPDETAAALAADNVRPQTHLVARSMSLEDLEAEVVDSGMVARRGGLSPRALILESGDPGRLPSVRSGAAAVQDEGSQLVALAFAAVEAPEGVTVDLCSGPGGKAALLSRELAGGLVALEPRPARAKLVLQSLQGLADGSDWVVVRGDGVHPPLRSRSAARVLVDAPCSGLGALRRRPESRWRRSPADITRLVPLQKALLRSALALTGPGGLVGYVTCSPHQEETVEVVEQVLAEVTDFALLDARVAIESIVGRPVGGTGDGPYIQLWPHRHGTDAMFLALIRNTRSPLQ